MRVKAAMVYAHGIFAMESTFEEDMGASMVGHLCKIIYSSSWSEEELCAVPKKLPIIGELNLGLYSMVIKRKN